MAGIPANISGPVQWAEVLLQQCNYPVNQSNVDFLASWALIEGGNWNNTAHYNPLNTTQPEAGSSGIAGNPDGVQSYVSWAQGFQATITALNNGYYPDILLALEQGNATAANNANQLAENLSKWSGGGYTRVPISSSVNVGGLPSGGSNYGTGGGTTLPPPLGDTPVTQIGSGGSVETNYRTSVGFEPDRTHSSLIINGYTCSADITNAVSTVEITRSITGAGTLTVTLDDPDLVLLNSTIAEIVAPSEPITTVASGGLVKVSGLRKVQGLTPRQRHNLEGGSASNSGTGGGGTVNRNSSSAYYPTTCTLTDGTTNLVFALVSLSKSNNTVTLTFEDIIVNQLRYCFNPSGYTPSTGSLTRADVMAQVAAIALSGLTGMVTVPAAAYPKVGVAGVQTIKESTDLVWGSTENPDQDCWSFMVEAANNAQWRCFSTGTALVFGPDEWLLSGTVAANFEQWRNGVSDIDFTWDIGQAEADVTVNINDSSVLGFCPGVPVNVLGLGVVSTEAWLVSEMDRTFGQPDATVTLVQPQPALTESQIASDVTGTSSVNGSTPSGGSTVTGTVPNAGESAQARSAVVYALAQLGKPYVYGGTGPGGYDCSGLCYAAYKSVGITIPRTTYTQWTGIPDVVSLNNLIPGDLVYYTGSDPIGNLPGHVMMYIGNGNVVQAEETGTNIMRIAMPAGAVGARRPAPQYGPPNPNG